MERADIIALASSMNRILDHLVDTHATREEIENHALMVAEVCERRFTTEDERDIFRDHCIMPDADELGM